MRSIHHSTLAATRPLPLVARLLIACACVYGPFLAMPVGALLAGCAPCADTWFAGLPLLPGRVPAVVLTDAFGANPVTTLKPLSAWLIAAWILLTAWCGSECRTVPAFSVGLSSACAVVALLASG